MFMGLKLTQDGTTIEQTYLHQVPCIKKYQINQCKIFASKEDLCQFSTFSQPETFRNIS